MKTLIISDEYPLPENAGRNIRTMNFVRAFANFGTVDLVYSYKKPISNSPFENEYLLKRKDRTCSSSLFYDLIYGIPPRIKYEPADEQRLLSLISEQQYDSILVRYILNTGGLFNLSDEYKKRVIVDYDDVVTGSVYTSKIKSSVNHFEKLKRILGRRFMINFEKKCFNFGAAIFSANDDLEKMLPHSRAGDLYVVPNIFNNESFNEYDFGDGFSKENIFLFVGMLNYAPNYNGLKWFVEDVFPLLRSKVKGAKLLVVGRNPTDGVINMCNKLSDVELYSDVPDLKIYYEQCRAVVVPLLEGSGTRVKILEAVQAHRPVITTALGAEGLPLNNQEELLFFDDENTFLSEYEKLSDKVFYHNLTRNALNTVQKKSSVKDFNDALIHVLRGMKISI